jgi:hypothetical protein
MGRMNLEGMLEVADPQQALAWHLQSNCYPPAGSMLNASREAIDCYAVGETDAEVALPDGALYKGRGTAPAWAIVDNFRLHDFVFAMLADD